MTRMIWPISPRRWVHVNRGTRVHHVQHIVARREWPPMLAGPKRYTLALCGAQLWPYAGRRPKVTTRQLEGIPMCKACAENIGRLDDWGFQAGKVDA